MATIDGSGGVTRRVGEGGLGTLGRISRSLTRALATPSVPVRCPISGHMDVVQHVADEGSYLSDVVTCRVFSPGQAITCGLPCLTGGVRTWISERSDDLVKV